MNEKRERGREKKREHIMISTKQKTVEGKEGGGRKKEKKKKKGHGNMVF